MRYDHSPLKKFKDVSTWSYKDISRIDRESTKDMVQLCPNARAMKQKILQINPNRP